MNKDEATEIVSAVLVRPPHIRYAAVYRRAWELAAEYRLEALLDSDANGWAVRMWGPDPFPIHNESEVLEWALELGREELVLRLAARASLAESEGLRFVDLRCKYDHLPGLRATLASFEPEWSIVRYARTAEQLQVMYGCREVRRLGTGLYMHVARELLPALARLVPPNAQLLRYTRANHPKVAAAILAIDPSLAFLNRPSTGLGDV